MNLLAWLLTAAQAATANFTVTIGAAIPPQTIVSITPTIVTVNVTTACNDGTVVTALTATMSNSNNPPFNGTWSESADTHFRINGSNLVCNAAGGIPVPPNTYTPMVTATPSDTTIAAKSQGITVTIVGSQVPQVAQNAGFNTLAANYDFSTSTYVDQSWLDCPHNTNPARIWHASAPGVASVNCNFNQVVDTVANGGDGSTVMRIVLPATTNCTGLGNNCVSEAQTRNDAGDCGSGGCSVTADYPHMYYESVARIEVVSSSSTFNYSSAVWTWGNPDPGTEIDVAEITGTSSSCNGNTGYTFDGVVNYFGGNATFSGYDSSGFLASCANIPSGYDVRKYNKYGMLETSNGSTDVQLCWFINDVLQSCGTVPNLVTANYTVRHFLVMGNQCCSADTVDFDRIMDIKYIRVWSCANWARPSLPVASNTPGPVANECNGSTQHTPTTGDPVTYWH